MVNERANGWRWPRGAARYNLAIARELPVFRPVPYRLVLDGEVWETEACSSRWPTPPPTAAGMQIAPDASPTDGLLDVVVVKPVPLHRFVRLFPRVYAGTHVELDVVEVRRAAVGRGRRGRRRAAPAPDRRLRRRRAARPAAAPVRARWRAPLAVLSPART